MLAFRNISFRKTKVWEPLYIIYKGFDSLFFLSWRNSWIITAEVYSFLALKTYPKNIVAFDHLLTTIKQDLKNIIKKPCFYIVLCTKKSKFLTKKRWFLWTMETAFSNCFLHWFPYFKKKIKKGFFYFIFRTSFFLLKIYIKSYIINVATQLLA